MTTKLTQADIEELREKLETERDSLEDELAGHGRMLNDAGDWQGTAESYDGEEPDPIDAADQIEELVTNVPLVAELEERHTDVTEALEKMDQGTYGMCEECGEPISPERLKANPAAKTCIAHADE